MKENYCAPSFEEVAIAEEVRILSGSVKDGSLLYRNENDDEFNS